MDAPGGYSMMPTMGVGPAMPGGAPAPPAVYSAPSSGSAAPAPSSPGGPPTPPSSSPTVADARSCPRACTRTQRDALALLGLELEPAPSHEYGQPAQPEELSRPALRTRAGADADVGPAGFALGQARLFAPDRGRENFVDGDAVSRTIDHAREFSFLRHPPARASFRGVRSRGVRGVGTAGTQ